jgi:hypothetical protein
LDWSPDSGTNIAADSTNRAAAVSIQKGFSQMQSKPRAASTETKKRTEEVQLMMGGWPGDLYSV